MALFEAGGWDIKSKDVKIGGLDAKKTKKQKSQKSPADKGFAKNTEIERKRRLSEEPKRKTKMTKTESNIQEEDAETGANDQASEPPAPPPPSISQKLTPLQQKMLTKLSGSRFRWINEQLYSTTSENALKLVKNQPSLFDEYHQGFRAQVQSWPENPVDVLVEQFKSRTDRPINAPGGLPGSRDKKVVIADMGCGEAQFALDVGNFVKSFNHKKHKRGEKKSFSRAPRSLDVEVKSFDLKKINERITVADIKNVPMEDESCNIVIFCLALMGTNFLDFIQEAYRILAPNGELWIAEIKSRFSESTNSGAKALQSGNVGEEFVESLELMGFFHKKTDNNNKMFTRFEFFKPSHEILSQKKEKLQKKKKFIEQETRRDELEKKRRSRPEGEWLLKPCIYKRR